MHYAMHIVNLIFFIFLCFYVYILSLACHLTHSLSCALPHSFLLIDCHKSIFKSTSVAHALTVHLSFTTSLCLSLIRWPLFFSYLLIVDVTSQCYLERLIVYFSTIETLLQLSLCSLFDPTIIMCIGQHYLSKNLSYSRFASK